MSVDPPEELVIAALRRLGAADASLDRAPPALAAAARRLVATHGARCRACARPWLCSTPGEDCPGCGSPQPATGRPITSRTPGPGDQVGPLLLLEQLGAGATGRVFRARHAQLGRTSAVKLIPGAARDARRRKRFERELEALGRLRHDGIVQVHASYEVGDLLACEMELIEGEPLDARLARGPLPWREAADLVARLARAIAFAHAAGVLHRDLKPENVLVRGDGRPVVVDLGLTRLTGESSSLTAPGGVLGTPLYMAPEAYAGRTDAPAVDVYGLGAVLHATLTGEPPVVADTLPAILHALASGPRPLDRSDVPRPLDAVRRRALATDPADRHASASALADDLEALLDGRAPPSQATGAWLLAAARRRRRWLPVAGAALLVAAALAALQRPERASSGPAPPPPLDPFASALASDAEPSERDLALLLAAAADPARRERLREELEAALRRAPARPRLRLVRAWLAASTDRELTPEDLAALSALPLGPESEAVVEHARRRPAPWHLAAARALRASHPRWSTAAMLHAEACLRDGAPDLRAEAAAALDVAGGTGELRDLVGAADRFAAALETAGLTEPVASALDRALAASSALPDDLVHGALAPVTSAARAAAISGALTNDGVRTGMAAALRPHLERLPPALFLLLSVAGSVEEDSVQTERPGALAAAGEAVARADALLGAWGLARAVECELEEKVEDPGALLRLEGHARRARALLLGIGEPPTTEQEWILRRMTWRRCHTDLASLLLRRADAAGAERALVLAEGVEAARAAQAAAEDLRMRTWTRHDARLLARLLAAAGRLEEVEPLLRMLLADQREAVRAELTRRSGDAARALAIADTACAGAPPTSTELAVARALALVDLGRGDEAREVLAELEGKRGGRAPLEGLTVKDLRARLARPERR